MVTDRRIRRGTCGSVDALVGRGDHRHSALREDSTGSTQIRDARLGSGVRRGRTVPDQLFDALVVSDLMHAELLVVIGSTLRDEELVTLI